MKQFTCIDMPLPKYHYLETQGAKRGKKCFWLGKFWLQSNIKESNLFSMPAEYQNKHTHPQL